MGALVVAMIMGRRRGVVGCIISRLRVGSAWGIRGSLLLGWE